MGIDYLLYAHHSIQLHLFNFTSIVALHRFGEMALMSQSLVTCTVKSSASSSLVSSINVVNLKTNRITRSGTRLRSFRGFTVSAAMFDGEGKLGGRLTSIPNPQTVREAIKEQCLLVLDNPKTRTKFKKLRTLILNSGENIEDIPPMVKYLYFNEKELVQLKLATALLPLRLMDPAIVKAKARVLAKNVYSKEFGKAMEDLSRYICERVDFVVSESPQLKRDVELWREELKKARAVPSFESRLWLEARARQISEAVRKALESPEFNAEYEKASYEKWKAERDRYYS